MSTKVTAALASFALFSLAAAPAVAAAPSPPSVPATVGVESSPASTYGYTYAGEWAYTANATNDVRSIAVSPRDDVFVLGEDKKIRRFTLDGQLTATWQLPDDQDPWELGVDPRNGELHVADWGNTAINARGGVHVYSRDGGLLRSYATPADFTWGTGIAIARDGTSYVANTRDDTIYRFSSSGALLGSWGGEGVGAGEFDSPSGIAVGADGSVYVTDINNERVQQFTSAGTFVRAWGQAGSNDGQFARPTTVTVAPHGNVFITDDFTSRVQEFTPTGGWVRTFGEDPLRKTRGTGFDRHGAFYAAGYLDSLVQGVAKFVPAKPTGKKTAITVKAKKKTYGKKSKVSITVSKKATGTVTVKAGKKTLTGKLKAGKATVRLPKKVLKPGNRKITVSYAGVPGKFQPSSTTAKVRVLKAKPAVKVKALDKRVRAGKKATFRVTVRAPGVKARGKVTVKVNGAKAKTVKLNAKGRAKVTVKFRTTAKSGTRTVTVTYRGSSLVKKSTVKKKSAVTVLR